MLYYYQFSWVIIHYEICSFLNNMEIFIFCKLLLYYTSAVYENGNFVAFKILKEKQRKKKRKLLQIIYWKIRLPFFFIKVNIFEKLLLYERKENEACSSNRYTYYIDISLYKCMIKKKKICFFLCIQYIWIQYILLEKYRFERKKNIVFQYYCCRGLCMTFKRVDYK